MTYPRAEREGSGPRVDRLPGVRAPPCDFHGFELDSAAAGTLCVARVERRGVLHGRGPFVLRHRCSTLAHSPSALALSGATQKHAHLGAIPVAPVLLLIATYFFWRRRTHMRTRTGSCESSLGHVSAPCVGTPPAASFATPHVLAPI
ncbi:hypothetical protein PsYK624_148580 [Phanerochaete sordida]|uniref:Uncharacterized protein n=1 Tax=Phanerochaete sordida TaxID=48140 RepID=A0A9P3GQR6_9APHY|nr:hypothetical protein PsYK624_148580 [Phanerochaete sordida]